MLFYNTCKAPVQHNQNKNTLGLRKTWQALGLKGPHPQRNSLGSSNPSLGLPEGNAPFTSEGGATLSVADFLASIAWHIEPVISNAKYIQLIYYTVHQNVYLNPVQSTFIY